MLNIALAKKFFWIFLYGLMEKPEQTFLANPIYTYLIFIFTSIINSTGSLNFLMWLLENYNYIHGSLW